jgi:hypothetical protein
LANEGGDLGDMVGRQALDRRKESTVEHSSRGKLAGVTRRDGRRDEGASV